MSNKKRNTFIFNEDWGEAIDTAPIEEQLSIYKAIRKYAIYEDESELPMYSKGIFSTIKLQINRNKQKYNEVREKRSAAGKAGNLKRWGEKKDETQNITNIANAITCDICEQNSQIFANIADNDIDNDNGNVLNKKNIEKKGSGFIKPTIEEIKKYAEEKGYSFVDAEMFWNFYESKGWYVGKNKMSKWRSAVANWNKTEEKRQSQNTLFGRQINTGVIQKDGFEW